MNDLQVMIYSAVLSLIAVSVLFLIEKVRKNLKENWYYCHFETSGFYPSREFNKIFITKDKYLLKRIVDELTLRREERKIDEVDVEIYLGGNLLTKIGYAYDNVTKEWYRKYVG